VSGSLWRLGLCKIGRIECEVVYDVGLLFVGCMVMLNV
jgi:hypothetical protein